jgi:hypothetical protein
MLGIVLELFIVEKQLLSGSEHKFSSAVIALENSVGKFHALLLLSTRE